MTSSPRNFLDKLQSIQSQAQSSIADIYGDPLYIDPWISPIGYGLTGVCQGKSLEKAAVSISAVQAQSLPHAASVIRQDLAGLPYAVVGLSIIFHPNNPFLPTSHANIRCFTVYKKDGSVVKWFGGGVDLTPYFPIEEDCLHWHHSLKQYICQCEPLLYDRWKLDCDQYFYLKHRQEPRGIGGVLFDDYAGLESSSQTEDFLVGLVEWFLTQNFRLAKKYQEKTYTPEQKAFQLWRRGRYAEFNLLYDRGTLFGLQAGGRPEAILLSLPPQVNWIYEGDRSFNENNELLLNSLRRYAGDKKLLQKS